MTCNLTGVGPPFRRAAIPKSPPFRKPSFRVCGGIVLDIVSYYLAIRRFKGDKGPSPKMPKVALYFPYVA